MRKVAINYCTFARDLEWTDVSLGSFRKYASGFSAVTIVVPTCDVDKFLPFERRYSTPECPVLIKNFLEYPGKGFVHHLAMKCYADVFQPDATHILHMDPDTLFCAPVTPDDYFIDGKPVLVIEPYAALPRIKEHAWDGRLNWKGVTEAALKFDCEYETMCRHPAVHKKEAYDAMRKYIESIHLTPFVDFVIKQKNSFPQGFGEFNTLGSYVHKFMHDEYHFWDRGHKGIASDPEPKVKQLWSYSGANNPENRVVIDKILA